MTNRDQNGNDLYAIASQARIQGDNSYHALTAAYTTAHSLIIAALAIAAFSGNFGMFFTGGASAWEMIPRGIAPLALIIGGLCLCRAMKYAQGRYTNKNRYWGNVLQDMEKRPIGNEQKLWTGLKSYDEDYLGRRQSETGDPDSFKERRGMRRFPDVFLMIYIGFLIALLVRFLHWM